MSRILWLLFLLPLSSTAQLRPAKIFTSNMVLQREEPIRIWGKAIPGQTVSLSFAGERKSARVQPDSSWSITLKPTSTNSRPQTLQLSSGNEKIILKNILVGDIWLCIGQSNMEWPMEREAHFREEKSNSHQPLLRFYNPTYAGKNIYGTSYTDSVVQRLPPASFLRGQWQSCDSNSMKSMSAVAYYFGKQINQQMDVPIGLINLGIGGAPLETFIAKDALQNSREFSRKLQGDWLNNPALPTWIRERGKQNTGSVQRIPSDENGKFHAYKPGFVYTAAIEPLLPLPIKGILNYQGESNAQEMERVMEYADLSKLMIDDYRKKWRQPNLPYYFVQLSSIDTIQYKGQLWPQFREEQRKTLAIIPHSGMAVSSDIGARNDVHPTNKKDVGERLARWALHQTYQQHTIPSGPLPLSATYNNGRLRIQFEHLGGGLKTSDGKALRGFSLDGNQEAEATITEGGITIVTAQKPEHVYYGWKPYSDGNLVNAANLPASTFKIKTGRYPDSLFSTYYHQRWTLFQHLPQSKNDVIFIGNSITDGSEWAELFNDATLKNRGISGDVSVGVINRIDEVIKRKPSKVFLMIGVNDLARGISTDSLLKNILQIANEIKQQSPATKLFVQSLLPVNESLGKFSGHTSKARQIRELNESLSREASRHDFSFVDLYPSFTNPDGKLDTKYTNDGLHLTGEGYLLWKHLVFPYVYGLEKNPGIIPLPREIKWTKGNFSLHNCKYILVPDQQLMEEAIRLQKILAGFGWHPELTTSSVAAASYIELNLGNIASPTGKEEAYQLDVKENSIQLIANTPHGIFNGIQTLAQLMRDGLMVDACEIRDWPAFPWRGYMMDVGRNYMTVDLLKQQIDAMARYKLNLFHFHATEDIAWRLASRIYPQLNAPEHMLRDKGEYYTETELKDLIDYCKKRHITFLPEIDMPGHSAAFTRAMKTDMQSDSGLVYVKNILREFITTYDLPYLHIGADEVKITNRNFIPEITRFVEGFGKKLVGWQPGGNFTGNTIRQLWMEDNTHASGNANIQYIDSRHLYLNHMDPLEIPVTLFHRQIGNREQGDNSALGGTLCVWHDRAAGTENDIMRMNAVYPGILSFAERIWRGGGQAGWIANISDGDEKSFTAFENRLLENKFLYFRNQSFPYSRQSDLRWKLVGPFNNGGNLSKSFEPEAAGWNESQSPIVKQVTGGTIILRHWWAPLIKGIIDEPKENSTWYFTTRIHSVEAGEKDFWIGFNNLSRSTAADSPPPGAWDNKGSAVWVNGKSIAPPQWKRAGQRGHAEIPLVDEGYEYREPTKIFLQKGWNTVLIKAPVGSFKGKDWQNPVKWMFTFLPVGD
ncbi:family 20 glycosylhydrolase [Flavihumibacter stibioxidans]|uniref:Beta-N-acetylhexosaminidase n=1 Tax=Flavihumibacter stibioxidans TaxID=1834163 RepID=A0ABR7MAT3_9BACT|nr:family 20 glycosylhydrolase [Flavihumibacter stibioxidans]MBC6492056.1 hypothetical protein [Flavihumibacter stibioxidans]